MTPDPVPPALLPALREDIRLLPDEAAAAGAPRWLLHDPVKDAFYSVGLEAFQIISLWSSKATAEALAKRVSEQHGRPVSGAEVTHVAGFLVQSRLVQSPPGGWRELDDAATKAKHGVLAGAMHNYLFFKVPLVRPAAYLSATLPLVSWLARLPFLVLAGLVATTGLYLASRQWADFGEGLSRQMTFSGALLFTAVLFVMKIFHELGHAYVATAMRVRVRSMGIAVMLFAPMLYTDVTDAWRLPDRRQRMAIDLAGVAAELVIAGFALFLWAFLPPGAARDVALVVATAAVVMTLAINLSPFMRFDGYYVLADLIGVKNLQPRAFALVRWKLRELLFGLGEPCPDDLRSRMRALVMVYGVITMAYRLVLYIGIAIVVYLMSFKVLGIILFLVEIAAFVAIPLWRELKVWWGFRRRIVSRARGLAMVPVLALAVVAVITPWSRTIRVPSVLEPAEFQRLYPSAPGEVRKVHIAEGQMIQVGDLLIEIGSARLEKEAEVTQARLALVRERIARRQGDARDKAATLSLEREMISLAEKAGALERQIASLSIRAGVAGRVVELDPLVKTGRILSREDEIGVIVAGETAVIRGYVDQQDLWRIKPGNTAVFIPDDMAAQSLSASLRSTALSASSAIDIPALAENHGGRLRTQVLTTPQGLLLPLDAIHLVVLVPTVSRAIARPLRGVALVDGEPQSFAAAVWRRVLKVLVQESVA